jgi:cbb3-type cytochrome oxidase subunit 3
LASAPTTLSPEQITALGRAVAENGRVLATLDDWRAMGFMFLILVGIIFLVLLAVIILILRANRQERLDMSARLDRALSVSDKFGDAANQLVSELNVQQALNARVETALGRVERLLEALGGKHGSRG